MARYITTVRSPWSPDDAFDFMADVRNFQHWDPGVSSSTLVEGTAPGIGAAYDVSVTGTTLRYVTREFDRPQRTVVEATSRLLRSYDVIAIVPQADGCEVTYDALLELNGVLRLADPLLGLVFGRIGDRAAAGLAEALEGEIVSR